MKDIIELTNNNSNSNNNNNIEMLYQDEIYNKNIARFTACPAIKS